MRGRYSIIGLPAKTVVRVVGDQITVETDGEVVEVDLLAHVPGAGSGGVDFDFEASA